MIGCVRRACERARRAVADFDSQEGSGVTVNGSTDPRPGAPGRRFIRASLLGVAGVALMALLAACGGSGAASTASAPAASSSAAAPAAASTAPASTKAAASTGAASGAGSAATGQATVQVATTKLGKILVDAKGMTLYRYTADKNNDSACYGACAKLWPILAPGAGGKPTAGPGVDASKLGVITRKGGTKQVTYGGWPLYTYIVDQKPGDVQGQNFKDSLGTWYVVYANAAKNPNPPSS